MMGVEISRHQPLLPGREFPNGSAHRLFVRPTAAGGRYIDIQHVQFISFIEPNFRGLQFGGLILLIQPVLRRDVLVGDPALDERNQAATSAALRKISSGAVFARYIVAVQPHELVLLPELSFLDDSHVHLQLLQHLFQLRNLALEVVTVPLHDVDTFTRGEGTHLEVTQTSQLVLRNSGHRIPDLVSGRLAALRALPAFL